MGMKLEAIREDRTRGGRSTYQCSYTIPQGAVAGPNSLPPGVSDIKKEGEPPSRTPDIPVLLQVSARLDKSHRNFINFISGDHGC